MSALLPFFRGAVALPDIQQALKYALPQYIDVSQGIHRAVPFAQLCNTLDGYRFNTIFEESTPDQFDLLLNLDPADVRPRGLYNPVPVIVAFYEEHVLHGRMIPPPPRVRDLLAGPPEAEDRPEGDLWVDTANPRIVGPLMQIWEWSRLSGKLPIISANLAHYGNNLLVVTEEPPANPADPSDRGKVYIEARHPAELTDYDRDRGRGHLTYARLDSTDYDRDPAGAKLQYRFTKIYTPDRIATFRDGKPYDFYGFGAEWENPHGFVPVVWQRFEELAGDDYGLNAYHAGLPEIHELCLCASVIGTVMGMHVNPKWAALGAEPPKAGETLEESNNIWFLPNASNLLAILANVDVAGWYTHINRVYEALEVKYPELLLPRVGDQKRDISGAAVRGILTGLIGKALRVRRGAEQGLIDAGRMALSMGADLGGAGYSVWGAEIGSYEAGEFDHRYHWPDILPLNRAEQAQQDYAVKNLQLQAMILEEQIQLLRRNAERRKLLGDAGFDPDTGLPVGENGVALDPATGLPAPIPALSAPPPLPNPPPVTGSDQAKQ